jgi:hypothetical protein
MHGTLFEVYLADILGVEGLTASKSFKVHTLGGDNWLRLREQIILKYYCILQAPIRANQRVFRHTLEMLDLGTFQDTGKGHFKVRTLKQPDLKRLRFANGFVLSDYVRNVISNPSFYLRRQGISNEILI